MRRVGLQAHGTTGQVPQPAAERPTGLVVLEAAGPEQLLAELQPARRDARRDPARRQAAELERAQLGARPADPNGPARDDLHAAGAVGAGHVAQVGGEAVAHVREGSDRAERRVVLQDQWLGTGAHDPPRSHVGRQQVRREGGPHLLVEQQVAQRVGDQSALVRRLDVAHHVRVVVHDDQGTGVAGDPREGPDVHRLPAVVFEASVHGRHHGGSGRRLGGHHLLQSGRLAGRCPPARGAGHVADWLLRAGDGGAAHEGEVLASSLYPRGFPRLVEIGPRAVVRQAGVVERLQGVLDALVQRVVEVVVRDVDHVHARLREDGREGGR